MIQIPCDYSKDSVQCKNGIIDLWGKITCPACDGLGYRLVKKSFIKHKIAFIDATIDQYLKEKSYWEQFLT